MKVGLSKFLTILDSYNKKEKMTQKFLKWPFGGIAREKVTSMTPFKIGFYGGSLKWHFWLRGLQMTVLIKNGLKMGWLWQRLSGQPAECAPILFLQMKLQSCKGLHTQEEKNLTAAKFSMNVQSWLQNHRFFEKKSAFFKKSKKNFGGYVAPIDTYKID